ncbi:hypothetical protein GCM10008957_49120 [Deinococcus ruber]|uniref:Uncharacterized protein n=1 Tax=Deinococcus ruber TaxID=1848197 RepID=A0A918CQ36_9DEIO|nr:hypothetical protein GCM10008957_49120 [Deinococcus ruber]
MDFWDIVFTREVSQEDLRLFRVSVSLEENVEHEAVLVLSSPEPVTNTIDAGTDLIQ